MPGSGSFDNMTLPGNANNALNQPKDADQHSLDEQIKDRYAQNTKHRYTLVIWMMWIVGAWLVITAGIVIAQLCVKKGISDAVMCALLTTTTVNVLGLAVIVLRGLFYEGKEE